MVKSSTTHKTDSSSQKRSNDFLTSTGLSKNQSKKQNSTRLHIVGHKPSKSRTPSDKKVITEETKHQQLRHLNKSEGFVINKQKKTRSNNKAKTRRGWALVVLASVSVLIIGIAISSKLFQDSDKNVSLPQSDTTISSSVSKPEAIESSVNESTALSKAQSRANSTGIIIEQSSFSSATIVKLNIPLYKQVYGQSCEAAALRMALDYRGITTTDMAILEQMGYDGVVAKTVDGKLIWADPHKQFVGDKNGDQADLTGYGVYGEPIATASEKNGRAAEVKDDVQIDWITNQLYAGNPVILWGVSIKIDDGVWQTEDGTTINAPRRTHTRLVVGFRGDPKNPTGFYLNDPATGTEKYWTTAALETNISQGIKQAVVIY